MAESVPHPLPGGEVRANFRSILPDRTAKLYRLKLYILAVKSKIGQDLKPRRHFKALARRRGSSDVIDDDTIQSGIGHFLLEVTWYQAPTSNRFRDICI